MADTQYPQNTHVTGWSGWIVFASIMMILSGIVHLIYGLAGISASDWYIYTSTGAYLLSFDTWGWSVFIVGILLIISAALLLAGNMLGRIVGVVLAIASILFNAALIGAAPIWSIIAIAVDLLIIYAIVAHGSEMKHHEDTTTTQA
jgi:vacuolar-type H+-ATPase subunit I/STV1